MALLDELEAELGAAFAGRARHPLLVALAPTLRRHALPREPFLRLIEANRRDQRVRRYESFEALRGYCALSANPVGELVLALFGAATPARVRLSDEICTALQLVEHLQDVREDFARGRVYLPARDLDRFGCAEADLARTPAGPALRRLLAFEAGRARALLNCGEPLVSELRGSPRWAVAAFAAGGHAALDALERAGHDPAPGAARPRRRDLARHALRLRWRARSPR